MVVLAIASSDRWVMVLHPWSVGREGIKMREGHFTYLACMQVAVGS